MATEQERDPRETPPAKELRRFVEQGGWQVQWSADGLSFLVPFAADDPVRCGVGTLSLDDQRFVFYLQFEPPVPPARRLAVAEFITRANFGITIGNFELDLDDGQVRYKSSLDFQGVALTARWIHNAVLAAMTAAGVYARALLTVIDGTRAPRTAVAAAEAAAAAAAQEGGPPPD